MSEQLLLPERHSGGTSTKELRTQRFSFLPVKVAAEAHRRSRDGTERY